MGASTNVNSRTVVHKNSSGVATNFPDVCKTPSPGGPIPIPYPNIAMSSDTASGSSSVKIDGNPIMLNNSNFKTSTGDEPGSIGGVVSGCTKGVAEFVNYSFDVKFDGKNVPRLGDMMIQNKKNTPPMPEIQPPLIVLPSTDADDEEKKCEYCDKEPHAFSSEGGCSIGSGQRLRANIIKDIKKHQWYTGSGSLQAHHLICSESMDDENWFKWCHEFGYDINDLKNGIMLPNEMSLACQLHAPLHRSNHSKGKALGTSYPKAIKSKLDPIGDDIKSGKYCDNPKALIDELNDLSEFILKKVDGFKWTLTQDGADYDAGGIGCAGVNSLTKKPSKACPKNRSHNVCAKGKQNALPRNTATLKIGT